MTFLVSHRALAKNEKVKAKERIASTGEPGVLWISGVRLGVNEMGKIYHALLNQIKLFMNAILFNNVEQAKKTIWKQHQGETKPKPVNDLDYYLLHANRDGIPLHLPFLKSLILLDDFGLFSQTNHKTDIMENNKFTDNFVMEFLEKVAELTKLFLIMIHLFSGQPARATELQSFKMQDIFIKGGSSFHFFSLSLSCEKHNFLFLFIFFIILL